LDDPEGKRLAGDLPLVTDRLGWVETYATENANEEQDRENERVRVLMKQLDGGIRLGVGEDLEQVDEMEETFLAVLASALGVVLVLGIGGGLLLSIAFLRRVDAITGTADAIIAGDLSRRIERTGSGDFDNLSATLKTCRGRRRCAPPNLCGAAADCADRGRHKAFRLTEGGPF
jgi:methyl-accepting chemotaxis protein